ncbi:hypothetical protein BDW74DRAFT_177530 [Aspergillus multicolor]|uniref:uncharacterized protein n=1 Tax=Aspergillus multicolor TaxID=41759 RepID=UPI003CCCE893
MRVLNMIVALAAVALAAPSVGLEARQQTNCLNANENDECTDADTSFSTSILHDGRTDSQEAVETADPGSENHLLNALDSTSNDPLKYPHAIHEVVKRDPPSNPSNNKPSGQGKQSNGTKSNPLLNQTATPVIKDWKHEKASVAASSIFAVVALAALILLSWTIFKKIRARQRRKKGVDNDSLDERRARREAMMFSKCHSAGSYMVEEEKDGKVIRVFCTSRNKLCTITPRTSTGQLPLEQINSALSMKAEATRHMEDLGITQRGRRGSIPKQIVVVSSPLEPAVSRTAVPQVSEPAEAHITRKSNDLGAEDPRTPAHSPTSLMSLETDEPEVSPCHSYRNSLLRLPSIKRTMSPLWKLCP